MFSILSHKGNAHQKTTLRFNLIPIRLAIIKKNKQKMLVMMQWEKEPSSAVGGKTNYYNHYGNQHGGSSQN
jgi:hypothetical protein